MAKTFNDMSDAEMGKMLRSRYDRLCEAHDMGLDDGPHPSERWAADTEILKAYREAAATGGVAGKVAGTDNPPGGAGQPRPPVAGQDSAAAGAEDDMIRRSGHHDVNGQLALAAARRANPSRIRAMNRAIPGLDRLK